LLSCYNITLQLIEVCVKRMAQYQAMHTTHG